jgi:hypothetical protein
MVAVSEGMVEAGKVHRVTLLLIKLGLVSDMLTNGDEGSMVADRTKESAAATLKTWWKSSSATTMQVLRLV